MPRLSIKEDNNDVEQQKETLKIKQGELRRLNTRVCNVGSLPLRNLRMKLPPTFLLQPSANNGVWEEMKYIDLQGVRKKNYEACQLYQYKQDKVDCGEFVELDLIFYCADSHIAPSDQVVFLYFEPLVDAKHLMPFRILCLQWDIEVRLSKGCEFRFQAVCKALG